MISNAPGHLYARHHTYQLYVYQDEGPMFDAPGELAEAKDFARQFLRHPRARRQPARAAS